MSKLTACPFCGSKRLFIREEVLRQGHRIMRHDFSIVCVCGTEKMTTASNRTERAAVKEWNERNGDSPPKKVR